MGDLHKENLRRCLKEAKDLFEKKYGGEATIAVSAPGRVNLIGEHTDYNDGFVLPMALPLMTVIVGRKCNSAECSVLSTADLKDEAKEQQFPVPAHPGSGTEVVSMEGPLWIKYVKGVVALMNAEGGVPGFEAVITGCVPLGGGVSSSASLEIAVALFVQELQAGREISRVDLALLCQQAEHRYAGNKCGIMDQFICSMAEEGKALLIDCKQPLEANCACQVPFSDGELVVLVTDSGVRHALAGGAQEYNKRRASCESAAAKLNVKSLRYASMENLIEAKGQLSEVEFKRARHVIGEIARTQQAAEALQKSDYRLFGELMYASHESLQEDYEVSCPELDQLVKISRQVSGVYGCRMTGGGFGGCTVTLVQSNALQTLQQHIKDEYSCASEVKFFQALASPGAAVVTCLLQQQQ